MEVFFSSMLVVTRNEWCIYRKDDPACCKRRVVGILAISKPADNQSFTARSQFLISKKHLRPADLGILASKDDSGAMRMIATRFASIRTDDSLPDSLNPSAAEFPDR